jgi:TP901 family phage tail tape measure protein
MATVQEILKFVVQTGGESEVAALAKEMLAAGDAAKAASPEAQKLVDEFAKLSATNDSIGGLVSLKARLSETADSLVTARLRVEQLEAQFDAAEAPSARLTAQLAKARGSVADLQGQFNLQQAAVTKAGAALESAGVDTANLDAAQRKIQSSLSTTADAAVKVASGFGTVAKNTGPVSAGIDAVDKRIQSAKQSISDFANKTTNIGAAVTAVGGAFKSAGGFVSEFVKKAGEITGIAAVIGGLAATFTGFELFKKGAEEASQFDEALAHLGATSGLTGDALAKVREQAEAVANETNTGAAETVQTLAGLTAQLGTTDAALQALTPTVLLSKAAQISLADATEIVTSSLKSFHDPALTAADVTDTLSEVARTTGASLGALTGAFGKLAPTANELGFSFKDTVAAIGLLQTRGVGAEVATRSLQAAFAALADPTSELRGQLVGLGINTSSLSTIIDGLAQAGPRGEEALRSLGARGSNALLGLVQAGSGALTQFEGSLTGIAGATGRLADAVENNLRDAGKDFSKVLGNIAGDLEEGAFAPLTKEVQSLTDRLKALPGTAGFAQIKQAITDLTTGAIQGFEKLIGSIDFKAAGQNVASFIADAGENIKGFIANLGTIGTVASGIGTAISVGFNGVKTVFFTVGAAASATIAVLLKGFAALAQAGGQSAGIVAALNEKADEYFEGAKLFGDKAAESARNVATGFGKLADAALASGKATVEAKNKIDDHTASQKLNAEQTARLRAQYDLLPESVKKLLPPFDQLSAKLQTTGESAKALPQHLQTIISAASIVGTRAGLTAHQLTDLQTAFEKLGVTSQDALNQAAQKAKQYFDVIANSSDGSAAAVANTQNAFLSYAEKTLAATAQLSDADKRKAQADLEAQASTLGVTKALQDLEAQSASSATSLTSDAAQYDASLKKLGDDALAASLAYQGAAHDNSVANAEVDRTAQAAAKSQGYLADEATKAGKEMESAASEGGSSLAELDNALANTRQQFLNVSEAAAKAFDTNLVGDFGQKFDSTGIGFARVIGAMSQAAEDVNRAIADQRTQLAGEIDVINQIGTASGKGFGAFGENADAAAARMSSLVDLIKTGNYDAGLLGQADLAPLQQALEAAAQRAQSLADAAKSAAQQLADLNDQLLDQIDQQTGNKTGEEDRRYQNQLKQIQDLYKQSGKLGSDEYNQAVANAKKLHDLKMQQIQQEQDAQKGNTSSGNTPSSKPSAKGKASTFGGGGPTNQSGNALSPINIHINGSNQTNDELYGTSSTAQFLTDLLRAKVNSQ